MVGVGCLFLWVLFVVVLDLGCLCILFWFVCWGFFGVCIWSAWPMYRLLECLFVGSLVDRVILLCWSKFVLMFNYSVQSPLLFLFLRIVQACVWLASRVFCARLFCLGLCPCYLSVWPLQWCFVCVISHDSGIMVNWGVSVKVLGCKFRTFLNYNRAFLFDLIVGVVLISMRVRCRVFETPFCSIPCFGVRLCSLEFFILWGSGRVFILFLCRSYALIVCDRVI